MTHTTGARYASKHLEKYSKGGIARLPRRPFLCWKSVSMLHTHSY